MTSTWLQMFATFSELCNTAVAQLVYMSLLSWEMSISCSIGRVVSLLAIYKNNKWTLNAAWRNKCLTCGMSRGGFTVTTQRAAAEELLLDTFCIINSLVRLLKPCLVVCFYTRAGSCPLKSGAQRKRVGLRKRWGEWINTNADGTLAACEENGPYPSSITLGLLDHLSMLYLTWRSHHRRHLCNSCNT